MSAELKSIEVQCLAVAGGKELESITKLLLVTIMR